MKLTVCGLLLGLVGISVGLYTSSDDVISLDSSNFDREVINGKDLWLVEFYAPWCGHCKSLAPEWKKAATALKGIVKVGAVDMDKDGSVGGPYNVKGFPTIKIFGANKRSPTDYNAARTAKAIVDSAMSALKDIVNARLGGGGGGSSGGHSGGGGGDKKDVIELTDSNFESTVLNSDDMWLVEFFAPWCGHCKTLEPEWARAATDLKGKVKVGALDATVHTVTASKYGVRGFPTIKMFPKGAKDSAVDYDAGRTASDIVAWANDKLSENLPPPDVLEVTEQGVLDKACNDNQLCMVSILPHILDCQAACRSGYVDTLKKIGEKYKKNQWGWVWAEAGKQQELEDAIGVGGFGYPAMAAVNVRKMKYAILRGSFSETGITEFVREVAVGRGSTAPIAKNKLPEIASTDPWDGKDGKIEQVDDVDLDDIDLEPLDGPGFRRKKVEL